MIGTLELDKRIGKIHFEGLEYTIGKLLGSGTQGEVYHLSSENTNLALKWYYPHMTTEMQYNIISELIDRGSPSDKFLWPLQIIKDSKMNGFGYVMPFLQSDFISFSKWLTRKVEPTLKVLITSCFEIAHNFRLLHSSGLCYMDISLNNVFFNPKNGDIRIGDTDNIVINGQEGSIWGTPRFMAPEIMIYKKYPNEQTDLYSLSVLIFLILFLNHPLEGKKDLEYHNLDLDAMDKLYGDKAIFIFDPNDTSNRPDPQFHNNANIYWNMYPQFFQQLFVRAFTEGLKDSDKRVREGEWQKYLVILRDLICYCHICGFENFFDPEKDKSDTHGKQCYGCKNNFVLPLHLSIGKKIIMINYNNKGITQLYPHHINPDSLYDFSNPIAEVTRHPTNPSIFGLKNLSNKKWTTTTKEGSFYEIDPGKNIQIAIGTKIYFEKMTGEICS